MKLIVGLGNPGREYERTRHNTGFEAVNLLASKLNLEFKLDTRLEGLLAIGNINGEKVILLKPVTYMNLSGNSVIKVFNYYKLDKKDMLIIYDDLDLDVGRIRIRETGSAGGHNGIKSIIQSFSSSEFRRVRVGISKDPKIKVPDYVLGHFSQDDQALMNQAFETASLIGEDFIEGVSFDRIMNKFNK